MNTLKIFFGKIKEQVFPYYTSNLTHDNLLCGYIIMNK
jgi:hypothetical protein